MFTIGLAEISFMVFTQNPAPCHEKKKGKVNLQIDGKSDAMRSIQHNLERITISGILGILF